MKKLYVVIIFLLACNVYAAPYLAFSDLISGPDTGIGDPNGSGTIVTIWGNNLGSSQGSNKVYFKDSALVAREAAYVYYWKDADGTGASGPADLSTYHQMQEIAFSIPDSATGAGTIYVEVGGVNSNTLPFTVRSGNLYHIKSTGNDSTGDGSWSTPWLTLGTVLSGDGKISAGDVVYSNGVGASADVNVGQTAALAGTAANPFAVVCYPNTDCSMTATSNSANFRNYSSDNKHWHFSKFTIDTEYQAFSNFGYSRIIGNKVTGDNLTGAYSGFIGGNCNDDGTPDSDVDNCSGHKLYGNEVYNYGKSDGTTPNTHHLIYLSNRSGYAADAYEVAWNYFHDNPVWQGIHIYDQTPCGGWTGTMEIHHNVIKNQGGNAINLNTTCTEGLAYLVYDNIVIIDTDYAGPLGTNGEPKAGIRSGNSGSSDSIEIYNNTIYGYGNDPCIKIDDASGEVTFKNNICFDRRGESYDGGSGSAGTVGGNLYYSDDTPAMGLPSWDSGAINQDPLFTNTASSDFRLQSSSPGKDQGVDITGTFTTDFLGNTLTAGSIDVGAIDAQQGVGNIRSVTLR